MLALACGPSGEPDCITACGMFGYGVSSCEALQEAEDVSLAALEFRAGWPVIRSCAAVKNWSVSVVEGFEDPKIIARTYLNIGAIHLRRDLSWRTGGALTHEIGHVLEHVVERDWYGYEIREGRLGLDCSPKDLMCDADHPLWRSRGIFQASYDAQLVLPEGTP